MIIRTAHGGKRPSPNMESQDTKQQETEQYGNAHATDFANLQGLIEVVSAVPTHTPTNVYDQVKIYVSGATYRLYICDYTTHPVTWHYVVLT